MIAALTDRATDTNHDGVIDLRELAAAVTKSVGAASGAKQTPYLSPQTTELPLVSAPR